MNPIYRIPRFSLFRSIFIGALLSLLIPMHLAAQCTADAGSFTAQELCVQNAGVTLKATPAGDTVVPTGFQVLYVLTGGDSLTILQVNSTPSFTVNNPAGLYTIHTLVYNPATLDLGIVLPGQTTGFAVNGLLVQGGGNICAALDVTGSKFRFGGCDNGCAASAGTLVAGETPCLEDSTAVLSATRGTQPAVPTGYEVLYVLTSGQNLVIEQVDTMPTFIVNRTGQFTIHTLVYDPNTLDLSIVVPGQTTGVDVNGLLVQGGGSICGALDVAGAAFDIEACEEACTATAGTLTATAGACLQDSAAVLTATRGTQPAVPTGYEVLYVLTSGTGLVIEQVNTQPTFTVNRTGRFTIHTLVYDPATLDLSIVVPGQTTGVDVNGLLIQGGGSICAALDVAGAAFDVEVCNDADECTADAGTLNTRREGLCLFSNNGISISTSVAKAPVIPTGYQVLYVLTSGTGLVIEQVNAQPSFTVKKPGIFTIHTLVYNPATLDLSIVVPGQTTGFDVNGLLIQGGGDICASLDVAGSKFEIGDCRCAADAGKLNYTRPGRSQACLSNGSAFLAANTSKAPVIPRGFQKIYVLTSGENLVIEQVNHIPVFAVNRPGIFTIHTLVYDPSTLNLGIVVPGTTTGVDVNNLLIQGGGNICAALDVKGLRFNVSNCGNARSATYPNPVTNAVNIELLEIENISRITIEIVDINGTLVKQLQVEGNTEMANVEMASLQPGTYFVRIMYDDVFVQNTSIVKMK